MEVVTSVFVLFRMILGIPPRPIVILAVAVIEHVRAHVLLDRRELTRRVLDPGVKLVVHDGGGG